MKTFAFIFLIFLICSASHGQGNDIHCMFTEMCTPAGATTSNELKGTLRYIAKSQSMSFHYTSPKDSTITLYGNKGQAFALRQLLISTITQDYSSVSKRNKVDYRNRSFPSTLYKKRSHGIRRTFRANENNAPR